MRKVPTIFKRDPEDMRKVLPAIVPGCEWVLAGEGVPTRKYDGTCCALDPEGNWWARREVKPGKQPPPNFRPIETDDATEKTVGWEPMNQSAFAKWHDAAMSYDDANGERIRDLDDPGTYELCGPKINGNPEGFEHHVLVRHENAEVVPFVIGSPDALDLYDSLADYLSYAEIEGIVWHHPDGRMAKIKRRDFPRST